MPVLKAVHKINLFDRGDVFLISDYQLENKLFLTLLDVDKCEAFSGFASDVELRCHAANIRMNFDTYTELTTKALTQSEYEGMQFLYCLEKNCQDFIFTWKSMDSDETKVTIGIVKMCKNDYQFMIKNTLVLLSKELLSVSNKVSKLDAELKRSEKEKEDTKKLLAAATEAKEKIEFELYSKFVLVLNEKKRKIRELLKDTENREHNTESKKPKVSGSKQTLPSKPNKALRKRVHQISESDSDDVDGKVYALDMSNSDDDKKVSGFDSSDSATTIDDNFCESDISSFANVDPVPGPSKAKVDPVTGPSKAEVDPVPGPSKAKVDQIRGPSNAKVDLVPSKMTKLDTSLLFSDEDEPKVTISPSKIRNRKVTNLAVIDNLPDNVQATLSQAYDSDSDDDLLKNL